MKNSSHIKASQAVETGRKPSARRQERLGSRTAATKLSHHSLVTVNPWSPQGIRFALQIWGVLSLSVVLFAVLTIIFISTGFREDWSIVLSLIATGALAVGVLSYLKNRQEVSASLVQPTHNINKAVHISFRQLIQRLYLILAGASAFDIIVDLMRIIGIIGVGSVVFLKYGMGIFSFDRGFPFSLIFFISLFFILFHEFVYPLIRQESVWETQYRYRKMLMAAAINNVVSASLSGVDSAILNKTEQTILQAIKSFLEFAVLDKKRSHFNVNLLVEHPYDSDKLICIQRTNLAKPVPTFYSKVDMPTALRVMEERTPIYISQFIPSIKNKDYRMVWQIPVLLPIGCEERIVGIIAIDSTNPHHLDLEDGRAALMFNLMPYIALIRFSLAQRHVQEIWDDVLAAELVMGRPHLQAESVEEIKKYMAYIEDAFQFDRNLDKESLEAILENKDDSTEQAKNLEEIAASLQEATPGRKVFSALFPYVESNNRRIHS